MLCQLQIYFVLRFYLSVLQRYESEKLQLHAKHWIMLNSDIAWHFSLSVTLEVRYLSHRITWPNVWMNKFAWNVAQIGLLLAFRHRLINHTDFSFWAFCIESVMLVQYATRVFLRINPTACVTVVLVFLTNVVNMSMARLSVRLASVFFTCANCGKPRNLLHATREELIIGHIARPSFSSRWRVNCIQQILAQLVLFAVWNRLVWRKNIITYCIVAESREYAGHISKKD